MKDNYIQTTGYVETLPKDRTIDGILSTEFLLGTRFIYNHGGEVKYEYFRIPVIAFRKYAKKCTTAYENVKEVKITGGLSWRSGDKSRSYQGFHICADTITIVREEK